MSPKLDAAGVSGEEEEKKEENDEEACGGETDIDSPLMQQQRKERSEKELGSFAMEEGAVTAKEADIIDGASQTRVTDDCCNDTRPKKRSLIQAFLRSLLVVDQTEIALVPGMRTALIMMAEMFIFGVDNPRSTYIRLGALYVGLSEPNGSFSRRLRYMGLTLISVIVMGALLPGLTWRSRAGTIAAAFLVALLTGLSPAYGSSALFLAMKLGMALFAINGGVNRSTNGYGGLGFSVFWTFVGAAVSLAASLLPEIIGNRDAIRTNLFMVWHGFGMSLRRWGKHWGTVSHLNVQPIPTVTLSVSVTKAMIADDGTEEKTAKEWLLSIMQNVDRIRVGSLCLSNVYKTTSKRSKGRDKEMDAFFLAVGQACCSISFALQFPWIVRYVPFLKKRAFRAIKAVDETATAIVLFNNSEEECHGDFICWLPSIVQLMHTELQSVAKLVLDESTWPPYSSLASLPQRVVATFPSTIPKPKEDSSGAIRSYALRLAIAFTLATIPELFIEGTHSHWFPMTVALIMGPTHAGTYEKVVHRVTGTLLGLGFGAAMAPLFQFPVALIILLGLNTYAVVLFFVANYALFTFFVTGWVFVTVVGAGAPTGRTTLYRCGWTLAAGALVIIVMYTYPPKAKDVVGEKLATMAKAIGSYAKAVLEESHLRRLVREGNGENEEIRALAKANKTKIAEMINAAIQARIEMLKSINEASLTPSEGFRIDPHSLAPSLAADLVNAVVIPQSVFLVADGSADDLLSDFDQETFSEIDRLVKRLEGPGALTTTSQPTAIATTPAGRGPFSNAIACAHRRLDEASIPSNMGLSDEPQDMLQSVEETCPSTPSPRMDTESL